MTDRLLPHEAAKILGVTPERVRQLCNEGQLQVERGPLNMRLIKRKAVMDLAQRRASARRETLVKVG